MCSVTPFNIPRLIFYATHPKASQYASSTVRSLAKAKHAILCRDEFKCVVCGDSHHLTIDHIEEGKLKRNQRAYANHWKPSMCETLCCRCHKLKNEGVALYGNPYI